jgi:hypothetical protein
VSDTHKILALAAGWFHCEPENSVACYDALAAEVRALVANRDAWLAQKPVLRQTRQVYASGIVCPWIDCDPDYKPDEPSQWRREEVRDLYTRIDPPREPG